MASTHGRNFNGVTAMRRTARLTLRPLVERDLDALVAIETDAATNAHRPGGPPSREDVARHLAGFIAAWNGAGASTC